MEDEKSGQEIGLTAPRRSAESLIMDAVNPEKPVAPAVAPAAPAKPPEPFKVGETVELKGVVGGVGMTITAINADGSVTCDWTEWKGKGKNKTKVQKSKTFSPDAIQRPVPPPMMSIG